VIYIRGRFTRFFNRGYNKIEDFGFDFIQKIPEKFIPAFLMKWLEHYTDKRIAELKHDIIRNRWQAADLENVINDIHKKQQA
jgi:RNase adaptor protein for sRNA GlmZ degradation